jgi:tetrahydromethanopterin S-methyltransferase subunit B
VTESIASDRAVPAKPDRSDLLTPAGWFLVVAAGAVIILGIGLVSFILGSNTGDREVAGSKNLLQRLQADNLKLVVDNKDLQAKLVELQAKLNSIQASLDAMMPVANTYEIGPNQSLIVADGHLTIGLIGTPRNESVVLNINSKQYLAPAGDVINVAVEPSLMCRVKVMSFDVLKARVVVNAICTAAKQ